MARQPRFEDPDAVSDILTFREMGRSRKEAVYGTLL